MSQRICANCPTSNNDDTEILQNNIKDHDENDSLSAGLDATHTATKSCRTLNNLATQCKLHKMMICSFPPEVSNMDRHVPVLRCTPTTLLPSIIVAVLLFPSYRVAKHRIIRLTSVHHAWLASQHTTITKPWRVYSQWPMNKPSNPLNHNNRIHPWGSNPHATWSSIWCAQR